MNWSSASTRMTFTPRFLANMSITILPSSRRSRPWSTKTQVSWSPMARWISAAATDESTPPDRPRITSSSPTCSRILETASSMWSRMTQSALQPAISSTKRSSIWRPLTVCVTSGWNCTA
ncbi:hypothetical protein D3C72_1551950 [compost metagenome]